jgi:hypothetical protein
MSSPDDPFWGPAASNPGRDGSATDIDSLETGL